MWLVTMIFKAQVFWSLSEGDDVTRFYVRKAADLDYSNLESTFIWISSPSETLRLRILNPSLLNSMISTLTRVFRMFAATR